MLGTGIDISMNIGPCTMRYHQKSGDMDVLRLSVGDSWVFANCTLSPIKCESLIILPSSMHVSSTELEIDGPIASQSHVTSFKLSKMLFTLYRS